MTNQSEREAIRKGDHNTISIFLARIISKSKYPKVIAPYQAEFFGTMMLVLTVTLVGGMDETLGPLAIGGILMCMVFTYGHLSGAHYNPAVSFAVYLRGKLRFRKFVLYGVAQIFGALVGQAIGAFALMEHDGTISPPVPSFEHAGSAFLVEFVYTFALATTVLNVATTVSVGENSFYGLSIGFVVLSGAVSVRNITGAVFNPAVGTALCYLGGNVDDLWLYICAPMLGGLCAGISFHFWNSAENEVALGLTTEMKVPAASVGPQVSSFRMSLTDGGNTGVSERGKTLRDLNGRSTRAVQFVPLSSAQEEDDADESSRGEAA